MSLCARCTLWPRPTQFWLKIQEFLADLLSHYEIDTPLISYHEHNAAEMRPHILAHLAKEQMYRTNLGRRYPAYFGPGLQAGR